jgi:hypothetical protein
MSSQLNGLPGQIAAGYQKYNILVFMVNSVCTRAAEFSGAGRPQMATAWAVDYRSSST